MVALYDMPPRATEADLERVPENLTGQIIDGELVALPRPEGPHVEAASDLCVLLGSAFRFGRGGPGGWVILAEPEIRFGDDIFVPDLAGWKKERFVSPKKGSYRVIPDWICEVLSPSTRLIDRTRKLPKYASHGVNHVWLVEPRERSIEVFRREGTQWILLGFFGEDMKIRAEPFDAVELDLSLVWPAGGEEKEEETSGEEG
jgi:Uma2 family endonuclease